MSRDHSRGVQGTNEHAIMLASRQHIKLLFRFIQKIVYYACKGGIMGAEAQKAPRACEEWADQHQGQDLQIVPSPGLHQ
jgi:hypothetical protein